ncbi:MAG: DHH family phosphoesterase [Candidatus Hydrogenedentota bacterium]
MNADLGKIADAFTAANRILVTSHVGIDGDSAGGALALAEAGRLAGKTVRYVNAGPVPEWLSFMPGIEALSEPVGESDIFDLGIVIDTSAPERVGRVWPRFASMPVVVIDHHQGDGGCSKVSWIDSTAASVTVMIAELMDALHVELTERLATALYLGIFTDTMSFQQTNTDARAHEVAAKLMTAGVKPYSIAMKILEEKRLASIRLGGRAASRAVVEDGICWSTLLRADYEELGATDADTEGVIGILRSVTGVRVAVLYREQKDGMVKVNMRSKDGTDVARVAETFGGGGHRAAAGCTVRGSVKEIHEKVMTILRAGR